MASLSDIAPFGWVVTAAIATFALYLAHRERKRSRIDRFISEYISGIKAAAFTDPVALLVPSGILDLHGNLEIREAFKGIEKRGCENPILHLPSVMQDADLYLVFQTAVKHGYDISTVSGLFSFFTSEACPITKFHQRDCEDDPTNNV